MAHGHVSTSPLRRPSSSSSSGRGQGQFPEPLQVAARRAYEAMSQDDIDHLVTVIAKALPGSTSEPLTIPAFRDKLAAYRGIDADRLRRHLIEFLEKVTPVAEGLGVRLALHPDDPPRPLFGLRVACSK